LPASSLCTKRKFFRPSATSLDLAVLPALEEALAVERDADPAV
jgi:hypothetical protein